MDPVTIPMATPGADMLTNLIDSMTNHIASLGTDMLTKLISCPVVHKMYGFHGNSHWEPWHRHAYKPYQLFNCA